MNSAVFKHPDERDIQETPAGNGARRQRVAGTGNLKRRLVLAALVAATGLAYALLPGRAQAEEPADAADAAWQAQR
ncbi:hypothetical protein UB46_34020 [Burkholderiaceae bacterium 16]|nr:hypothetical protein UB46_34020 [Burkholderiaceae bacterium 16]